MATMPDLASALQVMGVLLIPVVLLLEAWLPSALDCVGADVPSKGSDSAAKRDEIRRTASAQAPRMLGLGLFCILLGVLMTREALSLHYVGIRYEVIPTAWALLTAGLWTGGLGLCAISILLFCKKKSAS